MAFNGQLTYSLTPAIARAGQLPYVGADHHILSARNDTATLGEILFGHAVARGSNVESTFHPVGAKKPVDVNSIILGVAVYEQVFDPKQLLLGGDVPAAEIFSVLRQGHIWVIPEDAVVAGADVFVRFSGSGNAGAFRGADDSTDAGKLTNARWATSSAGVTVPAILELYGPIGVITQT